MKCPSCGRANLAYDGFGRYACPEEFGINGCGWSGTLEQAKGRGSNEGEATRAVLGGSAEPSESSPPARVRRMALSLPLPIAVNRWPSHHMALHKAKKAHERETLAAATSQIARWEGPPEHVTARPILFVRNLRDDDGAMGSLKWSLDALRGTLYVDDDPKHLTVAKPVQVIDRKHPGLVLELIWS